jgi:hypothetical protein
MVQVGRQGLVHSIGNSGTTQGFFPLSSTLGHPCQPNPHPPLSRRPATQSPKDTPGHHKITAARC